MAPSSIRSEREPEVVVPVVPSVLSSPRQDGGPAQPATTSSNGRAGIHPGQPLTDSDDRAARIAALARQVAAMERQSERRAPDGEATGSAGGDQTSDQSATARAICLRLLALAPRPRAGLLQALRRKEIPDQIAESVLDRLTEVGLINDVAYANSFVRIKHRDRALGRTALRTELRRLGVDEESTAAAVETVDVDAERSRATELITKRVDAAMAAGPVAARRRLLSLLSRRGYASEVAVPVVERALEGYSGYADGSGAILGGQET